MKGNGDNSNDQGKGTAGSAVVPPDSPTCGYAKDTDYRGGGQDITSYGDAADAGACCESCRAHPVCAFFTYSPVKRVCYLKRGTGHVLAAAGLISGKVAGAVD